MFDIAARFIGICDYDFKDEIDLVQQYCNRALALAIELGIPLVEECRKLKEQLEGAE